MVRDWVLQVNKGNARVWSQAQLPSLQWKFTVDQAFRMQMESKGINFNCFWKVHVKKVDDEWIAYPDLADMKRAVEYVTKLATIGEIRNRERLDSLTQTYKDAVAAERESLGAFPNVPPGVTPRYIDSKSLDLALDREI